MKEPRWMTRLMVDTIHSELISEHGGAHGMRDGGEALIESALARARNKYVYSAAVTLPELAAAYLFGLTKNHGYIDGNKRVGFAVAVTFLWLNHWKLTATEMESYEWVMQVAEGNRSEEEVAEWFKKHIASLGKR